jgi:hypothetical protein
VQRSHRCCGAVAWRVCQRQHAGGPAINRDQYGGAAGRGQPVAALAKVAKVDALAFQQSPIAD